LDFLEIDFWVNKSLSMMCIVDLLPSATNFHRYIEWIVSYECDRRVIKRRPILQTLKYILGDTPWLAGETLQSHVSTAILQDMTQQPTANYCLNREQNVQNI
jgi:hypothetical protein